MNWLDWLRQNWLTNEAISNYLTFLAGAVITVILWIVSRWISKKKPSIIQVLKLHDSSLLEIRPEIKEKLEITYEGKPIDGFYEAIFMVRNTADTPIEDIELVFAIKDLNSIDFLEVMLTNVEREEHAVFISAEPEEDSWLDTPAPQPGRLTSPISHDPVALDPDAFPIHLSFLNPYRTYEDYLGVTIYAPKPIEIKGVVGRGVGWTTKYIDRTVSIKKTVNLMENATSPIGFLIENILTILLRK